MCGRGIGAELTGLNLVTCTDGIRSVMGLGFKPGLRHPETESRRNFFLYRVRCSVAKSCPTLQPQGLQLARLLYPSLSPRLLKLMSIESDCHPTISSSVTLFSSCPQSFPASGSFPMNWLFTSGAQSIGASASASVLLMNIQDWSPFGWTGWISLLLISFRMDW